MPNSLTIYIAGPISGGPLQAARGISHIAENIRRAVWLADAVVELGHAPFIPHLSVLWELISGGKDHAAWLNMDKIWLEKCDGLLRIKGLSPGSEVEVRAMKKLGRPVIYVPYDLAPGDNYEAYVQVLENLVEEFTHA